MSGRDARRRKSEKRSGAHLVMMFKRYYAKAIHLLFQPMDDFVLRVVYNAPWVELPKGGLKRCSTRGKRGWR